MKILDKMKPFFRPASEISAALPAPQGQQQLSRDTRWERQCRIVGTRVPVAKVLGARILGKFREGFIG